MTQDCGRTEGPGYEWTVDTGHCTHTHSLEKGYDFSFAINSFGQLFSV